VLLERTIQFSRNNVADEGDPQQAIASLVTLAEDYSLHCSLAQIAVIRRKSSNAVVEQALAASNQAIAFRTDLLSLNSANFLDTIKRHAGPEPRTGTCDAVLVTPISLGTGDARKAKEYLETFGLVKFLQPIPPPMQSGTQKQKQNAVPSDSQSLSPPLPSGPQSLSADHKRLLKNPLSVTCTESKLASVLPIPEDPSSLDPNDLLLSAFVVKYKKRKDDEAKALNQERMYLVSTVRFLAALGIKGFPVFGLMTSGQIGGIMMAWQSESGNKIYILERNMRLFNLASPIEAFQFATFLVQLQDHTDNLKNLFHGCKDEFFKKLKQGVLPQWTKEAQRQ
jgi:hypothetical protein